MMNHSPVILFRCDGSPEIGLGHVSRCLALADAFRVQHDAVVTFAMRSDQLGFRLCAERGYRVVQGLTPNLPDEGVWLWNLCQEIHAEIIVLDVRDDLPRAVVQRLRDEGRLIVTIDDPTDRRLDADLAFYPPIPQLQEYDWFGFSGKRYAGWEWIVTRPEFANNSHFRSPNDPPVILVTMGGTDPAGLTVKVVEGLGLVTQDCEIVIVLGPGFQGDNALEEQLKHMIHPYTIERHVTKMWEVMSRVDLSIASFGGTAYELAAMHVPSVLIGLTCDHVMSASALIQEGVATCVGQYEELTPRMIAQEVTRLLKNPGALTQMRERAKQIMNGGGSQCIAQTILEEWQQSNDACQRMAAAQR